MAPFARPLTAAAFAAAVVLGAWFGVTAHFGPLISPALADDDGGGGQGGGGGEGDGGGGNDGGSSNSGHGSVNSGPGGEDDDGEDGDDDDNGAGPGGGSAGTSGGDRGGHDYMPDEVVVANLTERARVDVRDLGFVILDERPFAALGLSVTRLRVPQRMTASAARTLLASRFPGLLVDVNALYRPQSQTVLPAPDYGARLIGWGRVGHDCGKGIRIGVLDTAVDDRIPALQGANIVQRSFLSASVAAGRDHGTAVAAILVGQSESGGQGLLPGAELDVAEVFATDARGAPIADVMALVGGLNWLVELDVPIINLSLAGDANALVSLALDRVLAGPTLVIAAAGNGGPDAAPAFPAAEPDVIAVTAVDNHRQPYAGASHGAFIDFAAPGVRIWTPGSDPVGRYNSGTSFAVPFVVAAVAAGMQNAPPKPAEGVVGLLARSAIDLGAPGRDPVFGWGLVQAVNPCGGAPTQ